MTTTFEALHRQMEAFCASVAALQRRERLVTILSDLERLHAPNDVARQTIARRPAELCTEYADIIDTELSHRLGRLS
jgi:hypothetical protein